MRAHLLRSAATLAAFAVLASACAVVGLGGSGRYAIEVELARVYNLFPGSPVRVLGVNVGVVRDLHVRPGSEVVVVELLIDDAVRIPADVSAAVLTEALLGERYVQLDPPYTGGPAFEAGGRIAIEQTIVPAEFDEVLESLNQFVGDLDERELARLISNLAGTLDGQGEALGRTIDATRDAIGVLADNDDELVALARRLADLNETIATRDRALGRLIEDWNTVARALADSRGDIDAALSGLVRLTGQVAGVLETHRENLEADIRTVTRVGRTAARNLDQISLLVLSGAELFRHAERVFDRQRNWLPIVNHEEGLERMIAERLASRIAGACVNLGLPGEICDQIDADTFFEGELCFEPFVPCPDDGSTMTVGEGIAEVLRAVPELLDALRAPPDAVAVPPAPLDDLAGLP